MHRFTTRLGTTLGAMVALVAIATPLTAQEDRGRRIAFEAERRDTGWGDMTASLRMTLRNRGGQEAHREMRMKTLEMEQDGDRIVVLFDEPRDVQGTALLTHSHKTGSDDQWLYMPALRRVKRISSNNRTGPFMGSEFAYEDLGSQEPERYSYRFVREEALDGAPCFVIERRPRDESGYARQLAWIDKAQYRFQQIEFFNRRNAHLKTLRFDGYRRFGRFWRASTMTMVNHQTGKSTVLAWSDQRFDQSLREASFEHSALRRLR